MKIGLACFTTSSDQSRYHIRRICFWSTFGEFAFGRDDFPNLPLFNGPLVEWTKTDTLTGYIENDFLVVAIAHCMMMIYVYVRIKYSNLTHISKSLPIITQLGISKPNHHYLLKGGGGPRYYSTPAKAVPIYNYYTVPLD